MALIRANRESIDDRFSVLGFTVRTELPLFEIGLATDPELLKAENLPRRTTRNFFSSRVLGAARTLRGEAVYLVPPSVVARFVGQPRLYFGLATYQEGDRAHPVSVKIPDRGNMYVNLSGLTERGLRRTARLDGVNGYGTNGANLAWGGDALASSGTAAGNGAAAKSNGSGGATAAAPSAPAQPAPYSDGYPDDLWHPAATAAAPTKGGGPAPATPGPASTGTAPAAATAQDYSGFGERLRRQPAQRPALSKPLLVGPYYQPTGWFDALTSQISFFLSSAMWYLGVVDTTVPPHAAICQVRRPDGSAEGALHGSAFFIAPNLLLTAAHVVDGQSELIIVRGKNGAGISTATEPFGRFRVSAADCRKHPSYVAGNEDFDMGVIRVSAANAAPAGCYFDLVEELTQSRPEGVVVAGYAARWYATDAIERFVNETIDPNKQHMMGGYIRSLPTDETFDYDLQTLGGTSGSPVYWLEGGDAPRAHMVGVHVAAQSATTNLGCRITPAKRKWIATEAAGLGVAFSLARSLEAAGSMQDADQFGIDGPIPDDEGSATQAQAVRALDAPVPDYPGASRFAPAHARNFTAGRRSNVVVDRVVIHITAGGSKITGTIAWFQNPSRVNTRGKPIFSSAHYIVGRDGEVVQMVRNADTSHHATGANWRSIGIEHNANKTTGLNPTEPQYVASAWLVAWLCAQYNLPIDREHIVGHQEISPQDDHDCPSSIWDWNHYMDCVRTAAAAIAVGTDIASGVAAAVRAITAPFTQSLSVARRGYAHAQEVGASSGKFTWPAGMAEGNDLVKYFIEAYNARIDDNVSGAPFDRKWEESADFRARTVTLHDYIPHITRSLQSESGRRDVSEAILMVTAAVSMQVFDQIKGRLPRALYAISISPSDPLPELSPDFTLPRALPYLSKRIGMFMAWVDVATQQATSDEAERISFEKAQWTGMIGMAGAASTMMGLLPGLGTGATVVGLVVSSIMTALMPNFDRQYGSFVAAMQAIRETYKALASAMLKGLVVQQSGQPELISVPLHPDVQSYLDAHAAHALLGWQNELAFLDPGAPVPALPEVQSLGSALVRAQEIITPFYDPADAASALSCQNDAFSIAREEWFAGVPNTRIFPHSAICQLNMTASDGSMYGGTGFYIGRNRILTCAHNLHGMSSAQIIPGRNGAGGMPFGQSSVNSSSWRVAPTYTGSGNWDNDLAVIDNVPIAAPNGQWFNFLNATPSDRLPIAVCGYSAQSDAVPALTDIIDGDMQHLHGGYVAGQSNMEVIEYPIITLHGASGSPVYTLSSSSGSLQALVCGVHVTGQPAAQGLNRGCFITPRKIDWIEGRATSFALGVPFRADSGRVTAARTRGRKAGVGARAQGLFDLLPVDLKVRVFIPAPVAVGTIPGTDTAIPGQSGHGGDGRGFQLNGGTSRAEVTAQFHFGDSSGSTRLTDITRMFGESTNYNLGDTEVVAGKPGWYRNLRAGATPIERGTQTVSDSKLKLELGGSSFHGILSMAENAVVVTFNIHASDPIVIGAPDIDATLALLIKMDGDRVKVRVNGGHDEFPAYEIYANGILVYSYDPIARGGTPWGLFGDGNWDVNPDSDYVDVGPASEYHIVGPVRIGGSGAQALASRSLELEGGGADYPVTLIPQPDKNSCWAAAMAMLLSWRRNLSITPETLAAEVGSSLSTSYDWSLLDSVRAKYGFEMIQQPSNTSLYHTPQQWADWLNGYGALWVVIIGAPHAVVLAGIRGNLADPASAQVKLLNPWDTRVSFDNDPVAFNPANRGYQDWISFKQFAADFGNMAQPDYGNWRVLYLPVRAATSQSLGARGRLRLALPPPPIRTLDLGAGETREPIEPTRVPGTRMSVLRGRAGACTWALDQLEGLKSPTTRGTSISSAAPSDVTIDLGEWPAIEGQASPQPLTVSFRAAQGSVGDVRIVAGTPANLAYGVDVNARIDDDIGGPVASLKVGIDYRFRGLAPGGPAARIELRLLGDGRYERVNRWASTAAAA